MKFPFGNPFAEKTTAGAQPAKSGGVASGMVIDGTEKGDIDPTTGQPKVKSNASDDPLRDFTKLWENDAPDPSKPAPDPNAGYLPKIDPVKLNTLVGNIDFTKNVTPEQRAAIAGGGEGAVQAMFEVMNAAVRQSVIIGMSTNQRLVESGLATAKGRFLNEVPNHVKDMMVKDGLASSNPIMADPAFEPVVENIRQRFQTKYPKATPSQIEASVNAYFDDMHKKMTGSKNDASKTVEDNKQKLAKGSQDADWTEWGGDELAGLFGSVDGQQQQTDPAAQP